MLACMANVRPSRWSWARRSFSSTGRVRQAVAQAREALAEARRAAATGADLHDLEASALGQGELAALTSP